MRSITLAVLVAFAAASRVESTVPTFENLLESLNTTLPIWKKTQNYTTENKCTAAKKVFLNQTFYEFNQTYEKGQEQKSLQLYAQLEEGEEGQPPVMKISQNRGGPGIPYALQSWNGEEKCGILTFKSWENGQGRCEKHVWDEKVGEDTPNCDSDYAKYCGKNQYYVYYSSCKLA